MINFVKVLFVVISSRIQKRGEDVLQPVTCTSSSQRFWLASNKVLLRRDIDRLYRFVA